MILDYPRCVVRVREGVRIKELAQGTVVLSFRTGQAFEVNGTGAAILTLLSEPVPIPDLVVQLSSTYEVDVDKVLSEVLEFLDICSQLDVVEVLPESAPLDLTE